jgi:hypothetical protein
MQSTKQSLLGWQARVKLPHRHTGQTRPPASLGKILCRSSLAITAKPMQYIANEFVTPHTSLAYPFKAHYFLAYRFKGQLWHPRLHLASGQLQLVSRQDMSSRYIWSSFTTRPHIMCLHPVYLVLHLHPGWRGILYWLY